LDLVAFDFAGFSNKASVQVTLTLGAAPADTDAPKVMTTGIKIIKN